MYTEPRTDMADTLAERYQAVKERVALAARRAGRAQDSVLVVAVSKYADMDQVRELIRLGHQDFGESRAMQLAQRAAMGDELIDRQRTLPSVAAEARKHMLFGQASSRRVPAPGRGSGAQDHERPTTPADIRWHMIGHLQRNKVRKILGVTRLVHSVDSLRLVEEIQNVAFKRDEPVEVLVQVNCSGEDRKHGCAVPAAAHLCEQIDTMVHLKVRGLMTMAAYGDDPEESRPAFERCREVFDDIRRRGVGGEAFNILSMGMTNDFEVAISCGANLVRIGSAIFGERPGVDENAEDTDEE